MKKFGLLRMVWILVKTLNILNSLPQHDEYYILKQKESLFVDISNLPEIELIGDATSIDKCPARRAR